MEKLIMAFLLVPVFCSAQFSKSEMNRSIFSNPNSDSSQSYFRMINSNNQNFQSKNYMAYDDWTTMVAIGLDDALIELDSANFFIPENKIVFRSNGELLLIHPNKVKSVKVDDDRYIPFRDESKFGATLAFYQVLSDGDMKLLKKWHIEEKAISSNPMGIPDASKVKIVKKSTLYYTTDKGELIILPKKKKDLVTIFNRKKNSIISFAKENDISHKSESDLSRLFDHYNSMVSEK